MVGGEWAGTEWLGQLPAPGAAKICQPQPGLVTQVQNKSSSPLSGPLPPLPQNLEEPVFL